jgi:hypothetical protein
MKDHPFAFPGTSRGSPKDEALQQSLIIEVAKLATSKH